MKARVLGKCHGESTPRRAAGKPASGRIHFLPVVKAPCSFCLPVVTYNGQSCLVKQKSDSLLSLRDHPVFGFPYEDMWDLLREGHLFLKCDHDRVLAQACFPGYQSCRLPRAGTISREDDETHEGNRPHAVSFLLHALSLPHCGRVSRKEKHFLLQQHARSLLGSKGTLPSYAPVSCYYSHDTR